jgi:hypothetical protein
MRTARRPISNSHGHLAWSLGLLLLAACDADLAELGEKDKASGTRSPSPGGSGGSSTSSGRGGSTGSGGSTGTTSGRGGSTGSGGSSTTGGASGGTSSRGGSTGAGGTAGAPGAGGMGAVTGTGGAGIGGGPAPGMSIPCEDPVRSSGCSETTKCTLDCAARRLGCLAAGPQQAGMPCTGDTQCGRGTACLGGTCVRFCSTNSDCQAPQTCAGGLSCPGEMLARARYCR